MPSSRVVSGVLLVLGSIVAGACGGAGPKPPAPVDRPALGVVRVEEAIDLRGTPVAVAVQQDTVWVADQTGGTVQRVDARTRRPMGAPIDVGRAPFALAVGEGSVWVAGGDGSIRSIDPRTAEVRDRPAQVPGANGIAVGEGGVWVTSRIAGTVTRLDPDSLRPDAPIRVGEGPADVVVADGAVWVANAAAGTVSRVEPGSRTASEPVDAGGSGVLALAGGEEGIWLARTVGEVADRIEVIRLDPGTGEPVGDAVRVTGAVPLDLAVGAGSVWATDVGDARPPDPPRPGAVIRIDARTATKVGRPLRVGGRPSAVAVGDTVWVADAADGSLTPIERTP